MFKKVIATIFTVICLPVFAGELEEAMAKNENIMIYFYTPTCGSCKMFSPRFNKISQEYNKQFKFIKLDASKPYGYHLYNKYRGQYVPYIVLIDSKNNTSSIQAGCLMDTACTNYALSKFK